MMASSFAKETERLFSQEENDFNSFALSTPSEEAR
jgi:hypothetical protein